MADNNQDFIQVLLEKIEKDDLPTNVFDVEGTDPLVLLGKMNEIIGQLENFQSSVNTSNSTANEALSKAEDAVDTSGQALSNANTALGTANQAIGTANTAIETANQSLETANEAKGIAETANQNSGQAVTTANEAKSTAQEALDQVVAGLGTKIYRGSQLLSSLDIKPIEDDIADNTTAITALQTRATNIETKNNEQDSSIETINNKFNNYIKIVDLLNKIYPVGSIYMSVNSTNPSTLFGGTWEAWGSGRVPLAIGNNGETDYTVAEQTGGSENSVAVHNHLQNEHNHTQNAHYHNILSLDNGWSANSVPANPQGTSRGMAFLENNNWAAEYSHVARADTTGGIQDRQIIRNTTAENNSTTATNQEAGVAGGNRMPYITCYMWKRTA